MNFDSEYVLKKLSPFTLFLKHVSPSLIERGNLDNWYENRFLFDIYTDLNFVKRFDSLLGKASSAIDVKEVFLDLKGNDKQYDLKIFDTFSEIRFVIWAHQNGFVNIRKIPPSIFKTPDFIIEDSKGDKIVIEVKHLRTGNPFHDLANDRAKGLLLINELMNKIGLEIYETEKYLKYQHRILAIRNIYEELAGKLRHQFSSKEINELCADNIKEIDLLNNLLKVKASKYIGYSSIDIDMPEKLPTPLDTIKRLLIRIDDAKKQIQEYIEILPRNSDTNQIESGIIFITGISNEEIPWWLLSEELNDPNSVLWGMIDNIYASGCIIPTRIISNFGTIHDKYNDIPRNYSDYCIIRRQYEDNTKTSLEIVKTNGGIIIWLNVK